MSNRNLGVEMTILSPDDRKILMRGMILRRLRLRELDEVQVGVGLGEDINEIRKKFTNFDFETYTGQKFEPFLLDMIDEGLVTKEVKTVERKEKTEMPVYGPGPKITEFDAALTEDMDWFIDELPMSTRGLFDNMLNDPEREVEVDADEFFDRLEEKGEEGKTENKQRMVEDTREILKTPRRHTQDHGLRAGPTGTK